ncbi:MULTISPECIES: hypothetical protein [Mycolicibacterium]|jgi:hypothetical protein|uniref:RecT-like ssDNA binding protein n=3 Tax=Mycolicibacterium TaxID=1866885 RepID=A0AAE4VGP8_MYCFO|nr:MULTISPECIES: hypothetical protein [Mycolicibacterium]KLI04544.1 hypothetical protein AA982_29615 [Mycolicibacterium senegalense]KLO53812.1 hypothetical protein ABW05_22315 [Mycolicibacterium senegalense]KMV16376.1 hypothetical protein ACT17_20650 [Mycolicibacterium conceptionense]MDV7194333.1 hypothetical protein [Mycolicibacterium fortuitum]MDV7294248.1 hypothetical protein [Mycolicibacterium fortuitum]
MTTQLDTVQESDITLLPPKQRASSTAIAMLQEHNQLMEMAYGLAYKMVRTQFVPTRFQGEDKAEDATAAMLYGMELGLNPIQSLQRVIPIHGMPSLEARTMVALLQAKGYKVKTRAQSDEAVTVWGRDLDGEEYETTWTIERAIKAGYVPTPAGPDSEQRPNVKEDWTGERKQGRNGTYYVVHGNMKYITDPQAMLKAKAQAEVCREIAPEVLLGIGYSREDLESENWGEDTGPRTVQSTRGEPLTVNEVIGYDAAEAKSSGLGDKIQPATEPQRASEPEPDPSVDDSVIVEPAAEEKPKARRTRAKSKTEPTTSPQQDAMAAAAESAVNEVNAMTPDEAAAAYEATRPATKTADSADKDEPAPDPTPAAPPSKTGMRKAVENRLFGLFNGVPALVGDGKKVTDEERYAIYRQVLDRPEITSTDDMDNVEVAKVSDVLYKWGEDGTLADEINEIRNAIAIAQAAAGGE